MNCRRSSWRPRKVKHPTYGLLLPELELQPPFSHLWLSHTSKGRGVKTCKLVEERGANDIEYEKGVSGLDDEVEITSSSIHILHEYTLSWKSTRGCGNLNRSVRVFKHGGWFEVIVLFFLGRYGSHTCKMTYGDIVSQCAHDLWTHVPASIVGPW